MLLLVHSGKKSVEKHSLSEAMERYASFCCNDFTDNVQNINHVKLYIIPLLPKVKSYIVHFASVPVQKHLV